MPFIENRSPFNAELLVVLDREGREVSVLVLVASFICDSECMPVLCTPQEPVCFADEYRGDPRISSVVREADVCAHKPFVDVVVNGSAYAGAGMAETVIVELCVADIRKRLRISGDRRPAMGHSAIEPFSTLPIIYERALGGASNGKVAQAVCLTNPIGVGFQGCASRDATIETEVPNIEHVDTVTELPAGFGVIGRGWSPRLQLAGTYDESWREHQWPLPPVDFNALHFQCAPQDQQSRIIRGGEEGYLTNMTPDGLWRFRLPQVSVPAYIVRNKGTAALQLRLDTIYLSPETRRIVMCQRGILPRPPSEPVREIVLGHVTPGWLNARCKRLRYIDYKGLDGEIAPSEYFH